MIFYQSKSTKLIVRSNKSFMQAIFLKVLCEGPIKSASRNYYLLFKNMKF